MKKLLSKSVLAGACAAAVTGLLAACAVGPNFKAPPAPHNAGFAPPGQMPAATTATDTAGGQAQRFVDGMDIPGQWWTLFQSAELNALIDRALANSPTLQAAQAALRQANEIAAAQRGSYYPSVSGTVESQRQKGSGAAFGIPGFPSSYYYNLQTASVNVSYTLDVFGGTRRQVEALQAQAEYQRFALEASYLTLTANIVTGAINEASLRAQIAATEDIAGSQTRQLEISQRRFAAGATSRADVLQQQATLQGTLATLPGLRIQLAQQRNQLAAYLGCSAVRGRGRAIHSGLDQAAAGRAREPAVEIRRAASRRARILRAAASGHGADRGGHGEYAAADHLDRKLRAGRRDLVEFIFGRFERIQPHRFSDAADFQGRTAVASAPRRGCGRAGSGRQLSGHRHHRL